MKKFLGLPLWRKPLTDSELVERIRKDNERFRRYGMWLIPLHIAPLIFFGYVIVILLQFIIRIGGNQGFFLGGVFLGIAAGFPVGMALFHLTEYFTRAVGWSQGNRMPELLLKYHDALADLARKDRTDSNP